APNWDSYLELHQSANAADVTWCGGLGSLRTANNNMNPTCSVWFELAAITWTLTPGNPYWLL
ncbi:hypothetical protein HaLaN_27771, partial [Haematococcus lacustris]